MTGSTAYTSLEALLLFQYLYNYGINGTVFGKISELLKGNPQIRDAAAFDAGRLSPDALRDFFLRHLKEEAKSERKLNSDTEGHHGATQSGSRKRKAPSPTLPTIQDAADDAHLLPHLIVKLYARYREQTVAEIREVERRHDVLQKEVHEIEKGEWDSRLQEEDVEEKRRQEAVAQRQKTDGNLQQATALPTPNQSTQTPGQPGRGPLELGAPSTTLAHQATERPQAGSKLQASAHQSTSSITTSKPAASQLVPSPYRVDSPPIHQSPYVQRLGAGSERSASPLTPQAPSANRPPQSPGMLPPPVPGSTVSSPTVPQASPTTSTPSTRYHPVAANAPAAAHTGPGPTPQYGQPPRPGYVNQYTNSPYPSHHGGVMLQPFQVAPQVPSPMHQQQLSQQASSSASARAPSAARTANQSIGTPVSSKQRVPASPIVVDIARILSIPNISTPQKTPSSSSRRADTAWKYTPPVRAPTAPSSPARPRSRSVSPISVEEPSPEPAMTRRTRPSRTANPNTHAQDSSTHQARHGRVQPKRKRGGSTASSIVGSSARGRTRSQSIASQLSADHDSSLRKVKNEPSTPAESSDVISATIEETPLPASTAASRRKAQPSKRSKRKRSIRATSEVSDTPMLDTEAVSLPTDHNFIRAVRNFPRLSNPIMNDILSHKHASLFGNPVRDKDAEGYSDMIRRPTDLKTIKAAIAAGARAVNLATADMTPTATGSNSSREASAVNLPWSEDLIPPRGIVNSTQLEKELMRMFANAVMFNPGEEDVVFDSREMFESAAISVVNFKEAEKGAEAAGRRRAGAEDSDPDEVMEDESAPAIGGTSKRRKVV